MTDQNISDEYLNSFIDDQLEPSEKIQTFDAISKDEALKKRVCELRGLKVMMQQAYSQPPEYRDTNTRQRHLLPKYLQAMAACLLLLLGGVSGWFSHAWSNNAADRDMTTLLHNLQPAEAIADTRKIIVHLSNADPMRLEAVLDETEVLLNTYQREKRQIQIEVVANQRGVDLLRAGVSNYRERIGQLQLDHPNLKFMVCGQTINKLRNKGENVQLLPHTETVSTAAVQINKRLHQGWGYIRI